MSQTTETYTVPARTVRKMSLVELALLGRNFGVSATQVREAFQAPLARNKRGQFRSRRWAAAQVVLQARRSEANRQGHMSRKLRAN